MNSDVSRVDFIQGVLPTGRRGTPLRELALLKQRFDSYPCAPWAPRVSSISHGILGRMKDGKKVGITAGAFDLCHAGHMLVFKEAKTVCDYLIVALQEDPSNTPADYRGKKKNKPIMTLEERKIILEGIKYIDEVVVYNTEKELYDLLVQLKPDVRIIGADWKGKQYTGHDLPIEMYFNSRGHNFSTTALRERIYEAEAAKRGITA